MKAIHIPFSEVFSDARARSGLNQADTAKKLGICQAYVCRFEKGTSLPADDLLVHVCALFGLDLTEQWLRVKYQKTKDREVAEAIERIADVVLGGYTP